jgi:hypothetical protein
MLRVTPSAPLLSCTSLEADSADAAHATAVPAGVWGMAWREILRRLAPQRDALG